MRSTVFISKQVNTEPNLRTGKMGVNFTGSQGWRKKIQQKEMQFCLFASQICFFLELVRDNFLSNFLESLEVSRDRDQERAFIPKAKTKQTLGLGK